MDINKVGNYKNFLDLSNKELNSTNKNNNFSSFLSDAIGNVNQMQIDSDEYKKMLAIGEVDNLHDVTIASEKANIALQITMSIRNKIIEAYKEIMRMQF
ncbi:MAG: flagellar hook-basal body complex protein FliE [Tissierellaceae bacterium]|nr:flagellar hook-basal body complex protein FliE [Tissierellaceae bacterium]